MRLRSAPGLILLGILLLFVVPSAVEYYTDWLWFREVHFEGVFLRTLNAQTIVFALTFAAIFLFLYLNLRIARLALGHPQLVLDAPTRGRTPQLGGERLSRLATTIAAVASGLIAIAAADNWLDWLSFFKAVPFGERDPIFGRDVSFYVFKLPVYQDIRQEVLLAAVLALIGCGIYYIFSGSFLIEQRGGAGSFPRMRMLPLARRHLALLTALILALMAWGAWLELPQTLLTASNVVFGASYTDVHARIPFIWVTLITLIVGVGLATWQGFERRGWPLPLAIALYLGVSVVSGVYSTIIQSFIVTPNELDKEQPYIVNNIAATRKAYALDRVDERELPGDADLTAKDIAANTGTIENVRLWDAQILLQTFSQIQEIRTYYDFASVDNDRYMIDGKYRQVMLSARELNTESMQNRSWVNERLTFTHGYGLTLGPVNQVTTEGLPVLFIRDLPPVSLVNIKVDQPSIYYGELSSDYVLAKTRQAEFDYPHGDDNVTTRYSGTGGVPIGNFWRRLLFSLRFGTTDILVTNQIQPDSRILFHRRISDRVKLIAPFLTFDSDPYPVVSAGRLYWIQDAYTTTDSYPYSSPSLDRAGNELNYIRNSVKITIDAYNGSVAFYMAEPKDPLVLTLANIFPGMLHPMSEMPPGLRQHVRYPEDIFKIQASIYTTFHMTNSQVFYNKEDQWQVPTLDNSPTAAAMQPYYTIMKLPGETQTEFIQMLPFTPRAKDNLSAWMVARSDGDHYGHMLVFQFPKQKFVNGPRQIIGRINQDQLISPQITLWNQQGSEVIWGTLLVIPIDQSLLYVRPLYLRSSTSHIPELKRVVVVYQNSSQASQIVMAESLTKALIQMFGPSIASILPPDLLQSSATSVVTATSEVPELPAVSPGTIGAVNPSNAAMQELAAEAKTHLDLARAALKNGDLATYADEMKKVGDIVDKMNGRQ